MRTAKTTMRGVNLGGWLILEKWITPSVFAGSNALDEFSFCAEKSENIARLHHHREAFITEADFIWLVRHGIEAVRLPVGYWILDGEEPYVGGIEYADRTFVWAAKHGLKVLLDLHGAPGSQNGQDHSGKLGGAGWKRGDNIERTLAIIGRLAARYAGEPALLGIELLNEPRMLFDRKLRSYYKSGYEIIRSLCGTEVAVAIHDAFKPRKWNGFMSGLDYENVQLDSHLYQCFSRADKQMHLEDHLDKTRHDWAVLIAQSDKPVVVGEWSLALDPLTYAGMDDRQKVSAVKEYADAQLAAFEGAAAWFFWTYKTEAPSDWNLRHCIETGLLVL